MEKKNLLAKKSSNECLKKNESWTHEQKKSIATALGQLFDGQKQFGKTTEQLENIIKLFCWVLDGYSTELVMDGLKIYMRTNSDFPAPADIIKIIDPKPPEFKPNASYYVRLQKIFEAEGPYGLHTDEVEYIRKYEAHMQHQMRESS